MSNGTYQPTMQFSILPPVIKNLLILNGLIFLAQIDSSINLWLTYWFALWPLDMARIPGNPSFWPWQLVTYGFLHGGVQHLLLNMFALWMFGIQLENSWGSRRFSIFYFVCVIGAAMVQVIVTTMEPGPGLYPTVGASGGVFGLLLAFGMALTLAPGARTAWWVPFSGSNRSNTAGTSRLLEENGCKNVPPSSTLYEAWAPSLS